MRTPTSPLSADIVKKEFLNQWLLSLADDFQRKADNYFKAKQKLAEEAGWADGRVWTQYEEMKYELQHATNNYFNVLAFFKNCGKAFE